MKYYITIAYSKGLHLCLLTRTQIACIGRPGNMSFTFDSMTDAEADLLIEQLKN